uniref:Uncharacterized protein n=1 Tax=Kalanchoe fedtschenkoi TaxID=63787 RepID=A0A7N0ZW85_KALFE
MDDGNLSPAAIHGPSFASDMDFDYMNELLGDGCWLETVQGSDFLPQCPSDSNNLLNSPFHLWSPSDTFLGENIFGQPEESSQERSSLPGGASLVESQKGTSAKIEKPEQELGSLAGCSSQPSYRIDEAESGKRWWIGPRATAGPKISVMERLVRAISYIKDSSKDRDVLIQIWVPMDLNGKRVLTTNDQPYIVDSSSSSLASYRSISLNFQFSAEKDSNMTEGMPGRVFLDKVPEWTPDVRFFRSDEYARVGYAQTFNVRGTLALPVFERGSQTCLGVIEVVTTKQKVKAELDSVCQALQAVDLSSTESQSNDKAKKCIQSYHAALPEILEVMKSACLTHKLPLAQTWMPCVQQGKEGCRHTIENYAHCVSTVDSACYVADPNVQGFQEACSEHHLLRGQGVAGKAFTTNEPCFFDDITSFCKTEYPLSHHARMFRLHAAVAIRLRSVRTGAADFVLEFFLPADCREPEDQKKMLASLSLIIQETCNSLRVVTDDELAKDAITSMSASVEGVGAPMTNNEMSTRYGSVIDQSRNVAPFIQKEEPGEFNYGRFAVIQSNLPGSSSLDYNTFGEGNFKDFDRAGDKKRTKAEKTITLEVLQRHFSGSLKDAAKSLGVCPTTLKRICRNQGIKRWPSRKIKKVGHSLEKLQRVIDSVQGPSGTFQIGSFYSNFPELASPSCKSGITNQFSASKLSTLPKSSTLQLEGNASSPPSTSLSPSSSCSQSSSSSHSCSSGRLDKTSSGNSTRSQDAAVKEKADEGVLKRMRSDAQLNEKGHDDPKLLPRSRSHVTLCGTPDNESLPPLQKISVKESDGTRVKVTYGDDKIRIRMQNHWQLQDLRQEIARRFHVEGSSEMQLKYLDDDSEWVLLTCDADWEECVDLCLSASSNTIKLSLHAPPHHLGSSLVSSSPP